METSQDVEVVSPPHGLPMRMRRASRHHVHSAGLDGDAEGRSGASAALAMWRALYARHAELGSQAPQGLFVVDTSDGVSIRWCFAAADAFCACEVVDLQSADAWEAFVLRLPDGELRTGWRRRGSHADQPPDPWIAAVVDMDLGPEVRPANEPTFLALTAAFSAGATPVITHVDHEVRTALAVERDHFRSLSQTQAATMRSMRAAYDSLSANAEEEPSCDEVNGGEVEINLGLDGVGAWAAANADRIVILPRAIAAARKSPYEDPDLLYAALEMLADTYPKVKASELPRERLKDRADELGLLIGGSVDPSRAGMEGGEYFVNYGGRRRFLDQHVGNGVSRDPRRCLRIYYTWCADTGRVVIGWMPGHLSNSMS